jgi:hypothetical protein
MEKQTEQVIAAMRRNGGYATFGRLNALIDFSSWKSKTPQASIRRIVQDSAAFFKIKPGLWALEEARKEVLKKLQLETPESAQGETFSHSYFQGVLVEIGNMKGLETYVPPQDKNRRYLEQPLSAMVKLDRIYDFTYPDILRRATTVDVVWFNERRLPHSFFEVEHSTDIEHSLTKFFELQDYYANFRIVADKSREKQFTELMGRSLFAPIKNRVGFVDYDSIVTQHEKMFALSQMRQVI